MTKQGPDAANYLLLAKGHLVKAREMLLQKHLPIQTYVIGYIVRDACENVRHALKLLKEEETCKELREN